MSTEHLRPFESDPDTYEIIGAAMAVHTELGCGFLERVYREAFALELTLRGIPFEREVRLPIAYKQRQLPLNYRVDLVCRGVLVELKALDDITPLHVAQVINYLKASKATRALLINFGAKSLQHRRLVNNYRE